MAGEQRRKQLASQWIRRGILVALLLPIVYFLSAGPVFAYWCYPRQDRLGVCRYYCPVAHVAPVAMLHYLNWWGVSDIEAFFLLNGGHKGCKCGYLAWRNAEPRDAADSRQRPAE